MAYERKIITVDDPVLRKVASKVDDRELRSTLTQQLIDDMLETMHKAPGIGLAAPQVGVSKQIFVSQLTDEDDPHVLINPSISEQSSETEVDTEGCLSLPGYVAEVNRSVACQVSGLNRRGKKISISAEGLTARCFQHEIDHLMGVLIIDKTDVIYLRVEGDGDVEVAGRSSQNEESVIEAGTEYRYQFNPPTSSKLKIKINQLVERWPNFELAKTLRLIAAIDLSHFDDPFRTDSVREIARRVKLPEREAKRAMLSLRTYLKSGVPNYTQVSPRGGSKKLLATGVEIDNILARRIK